MIPDSSEDWDLDRFQAFLAHRRRMLAEVLNDMLGLRSYDSNLMHSGDTEVPQDDDEIDIETSVREPRRRDVARHILECFEGLDEGVELTIGEIAAAPSSQYDAGEISPGAIRARLEAGTVPGIDVVPNRSPMTARRVTEARPVATESAGPRTPSRGTTYERPARRRGSGRRVVGQHIQEVFANMPPGSELTIREIAAIPSSQYGAGEISQGAIAALLDRGDPLPGLEEVEGSRPRKVRRRGHVTSASASSSTSDGARSDAALAREFHQEMVKLYQRSQREIGYHSHAFIRMITEHGGVETARRLVTAPNPSDGFATLWEARRLDLTAEALVVRPRFASLFTEDVVDRARQRLGDYGFEA
jgi:hypothetical protein